MPSRILLVGLATDGPSNVAFLPKNEKELRELYGGGYTERFVVSPTATSVTLSYTPWTLPTNKVNDEDSQLYAPYIDDTSILFGTVGGSGNQTIDLTYLPYVGKSDLICASRKYFENTGSSPYVMRLGGQKASITTSNNWTFEAKYPGAKYNSVKVAFSGLVLTVSGLAPNYRNNTYSGTAESIKKQVDHDFSLGLCPVRIVQNVTSLSSFSTFLSGGTDGSFSSSDLADMLDAHAIPADVTHIVCLAEISSGHITELNASLQDPGIQPRFYMFNAPSYSSPGSSWVISMESALPERNNMIGAVVGTVESTLGGVQVTRYAVEAASLGFFRRDGFNITNTPVDVRSWTPVLTEDELDTLKDGGFMALNRFILNDIGVYQGTTIAGRTSFLYSSKLSEIYAVANNYCLPFLGRQVADGYHPEIASALMLQLAAIQFFVVTAVQVYVVEGVMEVYIEGDLPGEILRISFTIKNR